MNEIKLEGIALNNDTCKNVPIPVNIFISQNETKLFRVLRNINFQANTIAIIDCICFFKNQPYTTQIDNFRCVDTEEGDKGIVTQAQQQLDFIFEKFAKVPENTIILLVFPEIMLHLAQQHDLLEKCLRLSKAGQQLFVVTNAAGIISKGWLDRVIKLD